MASDDWRTHTIRAVVHLDTDVRGRIAALTACGKASDGGQIQQFVMGRQLSGPPMQRPPPAVQSPRTCLRQALAEFLKALAKCWRIDSAEEVRRVFSVVLRSHFASAPERDNIAASNQRARAARRADLSEQGGVGVR
ncbi:MAG: hypothetical protein IV092_17580 [Burkholderiaceae bacterium]|nr:hypothetical protein [Burkholderiaceae bacterium]